MTDFATLDALHPLPPETLSRQWLLSCDGFPCPEGWRDFRLGGLRLAAHPDARVSALESRGGEAIGWVLQACAHLGEGGDVGPGDRLALPLPGRFTPEEAERALYGRGPEGEADGTGLLGPWTAILRPADGAWARLYLGPTHSAVVWPERRLVAAVSPTLFPGLVRDVELSRAVDPLATRRFYPFGLTPFRGVLRLLPNHALLLPECRPVRHWPPPHGLGPPVPLREAARRIVGHARRALAVQARTYEAFTVSLSAGRDSRAVLACLRPFAEAGPRVELATTARRGFKGRTDTQIARRLAAATGLPHVVREPPRPGGPVDQTAVLRAFARIGEATAGRFLRGGARRTEDGRPEAIALPGMAGETARGYYGADAPLRGPLTPEALARRVGAAPVPTVFDAAASWLAGPPPTPAELDAAAAWLAGLPSALEDPRDVLDLAYVEQCLGGWDAPNKYVFPGRHRANLSLMGSALAIETMLRLPVEERRRGGLQRAIVAEGWPELLAWPFNEPVGWLRPWGLAHRAERGLRRAAGPGLTHEGLLDLRGPPGAV